MVRETYDQTHTYDEHEPRIVLPLRKKSLLGSHRFPPIRPISVVVSDTDPDVWFSIRRKQPHKNCIGMVGFPGDIKMPAFEEILVFPTNPYKKPCFSHFGGYSRYGALCFPASF